LLQAAADEPIILYWHLSGPLAGLCSTDLEVSYSWSILSPAPYLDDTEAMWSIGAGVFYTEKNDWVEWTRIGEYMPLDLLGGSW